MKRKDQKDIIEDSNSVTMDEVKDATLTKEVDGDGKATETTTSTSSSSTDCGDVESSSKEEVERAEWANPVEFVLSCLGFAVGFGNIWRFPYLCFVNGGGAFLIPYIIMMIFVGLPGFFIELAIGQYCGGGPMNVWACSPIFQGVGAGMVMITFISNINYNMLLGWSLWYLGLSWQKTLPWSVCTHPYNTPYCYTKREADPCEMAESGNIWFNQTCFNVSFIQQFDNCTYNSTSWFDFNSASTAAPWFDTNCTNPLSDRLHKATKQRISASEEFYDGYILDRSPSIDEPGRMKWDSCVALLGAWILCCLCIIKGIQSAGKVVYFTALFPYVILIILLIRGALLPGALEGIKFYIIPDFEKLASPKVWADAAGQVFFSLSVGMGGLMTFASYNKFNNNIYRDTLIVVILDALTSLFAGFAIFSILGYLAFTLGKEVKDVAKSGSGLAFIAYPEVVTFLEPPQLWSTLFFIMLITLGIDSQFAGIETMLTTLIDWFPRLRQPLYKAISVSILCAGMFLLGLSMCTQAGIYWLELMSYYSNGWSLILIGLAESIVFSWIYGADRLIDNIEEMCGFRLKIHWWFCWKFITPVLLIAILVFNMIEFTPLSYGDYLLPEWSQALGWLMAVASVGMIPIFAVYNIWRSYKQPRYDGLSFGRRLLKMTQPTEDWMSSIEKKKKKKKQKSAPSAAEEQSAAEINLDSDSLKKAKMLPLESDALPPYYFVTSSSFQVNHRSTGVDNPNFSVDSVDITKF